MKKLIALSVAALFSATSAVAFAAEVTRTDEIRPDPTVKHEVKKGKNKVKRTARKAKAKTKSAAARTERGVDSAADRARGR